MALAHTLHKWKHSDWSNRRDRGLMLRCRAHVGYYDQRHILTIILGKFIGATGSMKKLVFFWGMSGIIFILIFAIYRLAPMAIALKDIPLGLFHWATLLFSLIYMAYAEGYKGFFLSFAPRAAVRAHYLAKNPRVLHIIFAPLFCMGFIHATRKRKLISFGLTVTIMGFVMAVRYLPQPWRGILDAGVVVGLTLGCFSILYFCYVIFSDPERISISADVPLK